ncbi:MAG: hypothetical protein OEY14_15610, partial [Myxococcales bacterium]|nr:hypothetical protein [Myxococcales bacterium]
AGTRLGTRLPSGGAVSVGDGVQIVTSDASAVVLEDLELVDNARAGLLLDLPSDLVDASLARIRVQGLGDALGAIAQGPSGPIPGGVWDVEILRVGAPELNDPALAGRLEIAGAVGPMYLPQALSP